MAELYASVDGLMVPLADCTWVFAHRCGHPFGVLVAELPGSGRESFATEEQAWRQFYPRPGDWREAQERGVQVSLELFEKLRSDDEFWRQMKDGCECVPGVNRR